MRTYIVDAFTDEAFKGNPGDCRTGRCAMSDNILPFKRPNAKTKHKGRTLCRSGFHKWQVVTSKKFDVKQGKLVTQYRCARCGEEKVEAH